MVGVGSLISTQSKRSVFRNTSTLPGTFSANIEAGMNSQIDNYNITSKQQVWTGLKADRDRAYEKLTGKKLSPTLDPEYKAPTDKGFFDLLIEADPTRGAAIAQDNQMRQLENEINAQNNALKLLKSQNPELYKDIKTDEELEGEAAKQARQSLRKAQELSAATPWLKGVGGQFLGSMIGTFADPVNIASVMIGASASTSIGKAILTEAGINAGVEAVSQPFVAQWQREIGNDYGFKDAMANVGIAAAFGGGLTAVFRGARPTASAAFRNLSDVKALPKRTRTALKNVADFVHVKESNPYGKTPNIRKDFDHVESLKNVEKRALNNEPISVNDIKITEAEFLNIQRPVREGMTEIERADALAFNEFKQDYIAAPEYPKYTPETLPNQILNKFKAAEKVNPSDLLPEERLMLDSAGVTVNKNGAYTKKDINKVIAQKEADNTLEPTEKADSSHIDDFRGNTKQNIIRPEVKPTEDKIIRNNMESSALERVTPERIKAEQAQAESVILAQDAEFKRMAEEFSDEIISLDDGEFTMREILEKFDQEEAVWEAMRVCGVGK